MKTEKEKALATYYASDVVNKELTRGCILMAGKVKWEVLKKDDSALYDEYYIGLSAIGSSASRQFHQEEIEEKFSVLGHPPQLQDWLRLLRIGSIEAELRWSIVDNRTMFVQKKEWSKSITFYDGQPATEADYKAIDEIITPSVK